MIIWPAASGAADVRDRLHGEPPGSPADLRPRRARMGLREISKVTHWTLTAGVEVDVAGKPTVEELGIDVAAQPWQRSGSGDGSIEIAIVPGSAGGGGEWVLMRVTGDSSSRVLVYDRHEWECFLDGVRQGEFDDAFG